MRRLVLLALCLAAVPVGVGSAAPMNIAVARSGAADLCVGGHARGCFATLQPAFDAAHDGDRIRINPGTYSGGVTVRVSVHIKGAGAASTTISGGGPVLTVGEANAVSEPTVTISGITITGGLSRGSGYCGPTCGAPSYAQATALGGGIAIPPSAGNGTGATVTITDSVIRGNRAAPTTTVASARAICSGAPCRFAFAGGGGIDNWGVLTLKRTRVTDNEVSGPVSDAAGAGILNEASATLALNEVVIARNRAVAGVPYGRFAEGGGIFAEGGGGSISIRNSDVVGNSATLDSKLVSTPGVQVIDMSANSGGIHVGEGVPTTVENTEIRDNSVDATDLFGEPIGFDSAMLAGGGSPLTMRNTIISGNRVTSTSLTSADVGPGGSALELNGGGLIVNTRIIDNASTAVSPSGVAQVNGGLAVLNFDGDPKLVTVRDSVISGNTAIASSTSGSATALGGGIFNNSLLALQNVRVSGNVGRATGPTGDAQGGGVWNGILLSGPPVELTLDHTLVTHNVLTGSAGVSVQGGGVFTTSPITLRKSPIVLNAPDQCVGC